MVEAAGLHDLNRAGANPFELGDPEDSERVGWFTPQRLAEYWRFCSMQQDQCTCPDGTL